MGPMLGLPVRRLARRRRALARAAAGDAGGALVRLAVPRARRALVPHLEPQHVQPDRHGRRRRLCLQRRGDASRRDCSPPASATTTRARSASTSRPPRSSSCWCCSARSSSSGARERTGSAIRALLDLAPPTARVIRADGREEEVPLAAVAVGDRLRVRPGEKVPVDGDRARRPLVGRRVDADRRAGAGREDRRRPGDRRHAQRHRQPRHRGDAASAATRCSPASSRWSPRRSARARRSSASPTRSPAGSCRR